MRMLTQRDKDVLRFIEKYRAITTKQATDIFFCGLEKSAIRRLNQLEDEQILTSYKSGKNKVYQYNECGNVSTHDLGILDFYAWIISNGGEIIEFRKEPRFFNGLLRPDAIMKFKIPYEGTDYNINAILEYDLTHYTENTKLNVWYEKLAREKVIGEFLLIIARPTNSIRYSAKNYSIVYTDLKFNNILPLIFN